MVSHRGQLCMEHNLTPCSTISLLRLQHLRANAGGHSLPPGCAALDLLAQLLTYDPAQRCTAQNALRHHYFSEVTD